MTKIGGLEILSSFEEGNLEPKTAYMEAREVDSPETVFINCMAWRTFEIIECLAKDIGKPVITSNQATFVGLFESIRGFGSQGVWPTTGLGTENFTK